MDVEILLQAFGIGASGASGGGIVFYVMRQIFNYANGRNKVEEREAEAIIASEQKEQALTDAIGKLSDALVAFSNANNDSTVAMREVATTLSQFKLDNIGQHKQTMDVIRS